MSGLEKLTNNRDQMLLAEIAGLLHNIGKLDPNFLAPRVRDKEDAKREVIGELLNIPSYEFERFAAPDPGLLANKWRDLVKQDVPTLEEAIQKAIADDPHADEKLRAIRTFRAFCRANGPLYRCFSSDRPERIADWQRALQEKEETQQEVTRLDERIAELAQALDRATSSADKKKLGTEFNEIKKQREQAKNRLDQAESQLEQEKQQIEQDIPAEEVKAQAEIEASFRQAPLRVTDESWPLADLLTLFWDKFFYREESGEGSDYTRKSALSPWLKRGRDTGLLALFILSHGEVSGTEKRWPSGEPVDTQRPNWHNLRAATTFGFGKTVVAKWALPEKRHTLIRVALETCDAPASRRESLANQAEPILAMGLGDTQWPINEIDLWDYASSIAALFKSGVARAVMEGEIPSVGKMHWRFLSLRFDGLAYLSQVHHVTDMLGRRRVVTATLDAAQQLLEETYPLGNQVYRDENGSVFVVPDLPDRAILHLTDQSGERLETLLERAFAEAEEEEDQGTALADELVPALRTGPRVRGKKLKLGEYLRAVPLPLTADAAQMADWWRGEQAESKEICTVCGARPVGYRPPDVEMPGWVKPDKAENRHVCCVCLQRRGRRAQDWLRNESGTTIWADEVVDANGRFALLVGRFGLEGWLDGTLIPTLQKPSSFARIRRCWESTRAFWQEVEDHVVPGELTDRPRLEIRPRNQDELQSSLGAYHTYELQIGGQTLGVVWDPQSRRFILTENLDDLKRRFGLDEKEAAVPAIQGRLRDHADAAWPVLEPSGYLSPAQSTGHSVTFESALGSETTYTPHIPLLTEPALFMSLVPADKAMEVVRAIKEKYEREMSKVRDRLPLHLGVVIAQRRTPLRAVLEAGRAMLEARGEGQGATAWEEWTVAEEPGEEETADEAPDYLKRDGQHFARWWDVALRRNGREMKLRIGAVMGDGETPDVWYPHLLKREPALGEAIDPNADVTHVKDLQPEQPVYVAPSTFDFEYLDTTARRFEIAYDDEGRRRGRPTRPYLLDETDELQQVWDLINERLTTAQWMALDGLIERKREEWDEPRGSTTAYSGAFEHLVSNALRSAEWKWETDDEKRRRWSQLTSDEQKLLKRAAQYGMLNDVINLYHEAMKERPQEG